MVKVMEVGNSSLHPCTGMKRFLVILEARLCQIGEDKDYNTGQDELCSKKGQSLHQLLITEFVTFISWKELNLGINLKQKRVLLNQCKRTLGAGS